MVLGKGFCQYFCLALCEVSILFSEAEAIGGILMRRLVIITLKMLLLGLQPSIILFYRSSFSGLISMTILFLRPLDI